MMADYYKNYYGSNESYLMMTIPGSSMTQQLISEQRWELVDEDQILEVLTGTIWSNDELVMMMMMVSKMIKIDGDKLMNTPS